MDTSLDYVHRFFLPETFFRNDKKMDNNSFYEWQRYDPITSRLCVDITHVIIPLATFRQSISLINIMIMNDIITREMAILFNIIRCRLYYLY